MLEVYIKIRTDDDGLQDCNKNQENLEDHSNNEEDDYVRFG